MVVNGLIAACTEQGLQLLGQHGAHAYGVELDQVREHLAKLALQVLAVLLHLHLHVLSSEQGIKGCIGSGLDIGWEMLRQVVDTLGHQVFIQLVENVLDER